MLVCSWLGENEKPPLGGVFARGEYRLVLPPRLVLSSLRTSWGHEQKLCYQHPGLARSEHLRHLPRGRRYRLDANVLRRVSPDNEVETASVDVVIEGVDPNLADSGNLDPHHIAVGVDLHSVNSWLVHNHLAVGP